MTRKLIAPFVVIALTALALTGCSSGTSTGAARSTPSASETAHRVEEKVIPCKNGVATIVDSNIKASVNGKCSTVRISASNSLVRLGSVKSITIEGTINKVDTTGVEHVAITGNGNVVVTPSNPVVTDNGEQNEVTHEENGQ